MKTHTSEKKPFACTICGYTTTRRNHFNRHLRVHSGEKPFACKQCDFTATQKDHLTRHLRLHTGQKPFACPHCSFTSARKEDLTTHLRFHTGVKKVGVTYACHGCTYTTMRKGDMARHIRRRHPLATSGPIVQVVPPQRSPSPAAAFDSDEQGSESEVSASEDGPAEATGRLAL
jgi:uncharacterized Zn-finger protein